MSIFSNIGKGIINTVVLPSANAILKTASKVTGKTYQTATLDNTFTSKAGTVYKNLLGASAITTAVVLPGTAKAKVITASALTVVGSAAQSKKVAEKINKAVVSTPSSLSNIGTNVGKLIEDPTLKNAAAIYKENPVLSTGITVAGLGTAALGVGSLVANISNTEAVKQNTKTFEEQTKGQTFSIQPIQEALNQSQPQTIIYNLPPAVAPTTATAPEVPTQATISPVATKTTTKKKKKKKTTKKKKKTTKKKKKTTKKKKKKTTKKKKR